MPHTLGQYLEEYLAAAGLAGRDISRRSAPGAAGALALKK